MTRFLQQFYRQTIPSTVFQFFAPGSTPDTPRLVKPSDTLRELQLTSPQVTIRMSFHARTLTVSRPAPVTQNLPRGNGHFGSFKIAVQFPSAPPVAAATTIAAPPPQAALPPAAPHQALPPQAAPLQAAPPQAALLRAAPPQAAAAVPAHATPDDEPTAMSQRQHASVTPSPEQNLVRTRSFLSLVTHAHTCCGRACVCVGARAHTHTHTHTASGPSDGGRSAGPVERYRGPVSLSFRPCPWPAPATSPCPHTLITTFVDAVHIYHPGTNPPARSMYCLPLRTLRRT